MTRTKQVVLWSAGILMAIAVLVLSLGWWWLTSLVQIEQTDAVRASAAFGEVRARFAGVAPAFELRGDRLLVLTQRTAPAFPPPAAAHIMLWDPERRTLSRLTLPYWTSAVATEPLPLEALLGAADGGGLGAILESKRRGTDLDVRIRDLEGYGRTLLVDGRTSDGKQVLMWGE
jgi:hypothetical protein